MSCNCGVTVLKGDKGDRGPAGPQGPEGPQGSFGYGFYVGNLRQIGTAAPSVLYENSSLFTPEWTRVSTGIYQLASTGSFPNQAKVWSSCYVVDSGPDVYTGVPIISNSTGLVIGYYMLYYVSANALRLRVVNTSGTLVDFSTLGSFTFSLPEIRVYP